MPLVATQDVTLHKVIGEGETPKGDKVELTEGLPLVAGDVVPLKEIASYQQAALKDKDSDLSKLVIEMSDAEHQRILAARSDGLVTITNEETKAPGDVTVTKTAVATEEA